MMSLHWNVAQLMNNEWNSSRESASYPSVEEFSFLKGLHHDISTKSVQHHTTPRIASAEGHNKTERKLLVRC